MELLLIDVPLKPLSMDKGLTVHRGLSRIDGVDDLCPFQGLDKSFEFHLSNHSMFEQFPEIGLKRSRRFLPVPPFFE